MIQAESAFFLFLGMAVIVTGPTNLFAEAGDTVIFNCTSDNHVGIEWYEYITSGGGEQIARNDVLTYNGPAERLARYSAYQNGNDYWLVIQPATAEDEGTYGCQEITQHIPFYYTLNIVGKSSSFAFVYICITNSPTKNSYLITVPDIGVANKLSWFCKKKKKKTSLK